MLYKPVFCLMAWLCLALTAAHAQSADSLTGKLTNFPTRLFGKIQAQSDSLNQQVSSQTQQYLARMARREARLQKKLSTVDSAGAKQLFAGSQQQYAALASRMRTDTGSAKSTFSGQYQPYTDTMRGAMSFLQQHPQLLSTGSPSVPGISGLSAAAPQVSQQAAKIQAAASQLQAV